MTPLGCLASLWARTAFEVGKLGGGGWGAGVMIGSSLELAGPGWEPGLRGDVSGAGGGGVGQGALSWVT